MGAPTWAVKSTNLSRVNPVSPFSSPSGQPPQSTLTGLAVRASNMPKSDPSAVTEFVPCLVTALNTAPATHLELRGGAEGDDLDLFDGVRVRPRPRRARHGGGVVRAVHQVGVLVGPGAVGRDPVARAARRVRRGHARRRLGEVEHAEAAQRRVLHELVAVVGRQARLAGVDDRCLTGDRDRVGEASEVQGDVPLDVAAEHDTEPLLAIRREAVHLDLELVGAGREVPEAVASLPVGNGRFGVLPEAPVRRE